MLNRLTSRLVPAAILGFILILSGCGGGSSSSDNSILNNDAPSPQQNTSVQDGVEGPLDMLQEPLSASVLTQLEAALAGTPLAGVIDCVDQAVVIDLLDVVDSLALALTQAPLGDPAASFEEAAGNIQASLNELAVDLPNLLVALTGGDCSSGDTGGGGFAGLDGNPLSGTPLEPLGAALAPVLSLLATNNPDQDLDLTTLSNLVSTLNEAFQEGLAQSLALDPTGQIESAPVLGGLLSTLSTTLNDLDNTMQSAGVYDAEGTTAGIETTLNNLLVNVLTQVVPISFIEAQAGQDGLFSSQIENGVMMITSQLSAGLNTILDPLFATAMEGPLTSLLNPIENTLLPALLGPISDALIGGGSGGAGITGTPLDAVLDPVLGPLTSLLGGGLGGGGGSTGPTGTPLDLLLGPLADAINGGGVGACPVAGSPLEPLCPVVDGLLGALSADPSGDPLAILTGLVNTLLGGLLGGLG
mgnify:CR=1 FL=1